MKQTITESQLRRIILKEIESMVETETAGDTSTSTVSGEANTDPIVKYLIQLGVTQADATQLKIVFKALKDGTLDIKTASTQLKTQQKNALVIAFLNLVSSTEPNLITNFANAVKGVTVANKDSATAK